MDSDGNDGGYTQSGGSITPSTFNGATITIAWMFNAGPNHVFFIGFTAPVMFTNIIITSEFGIETLVFNQFTGDYTSWHANLTNTPSNWLLDGNTVEFTIVP